MIWKRLKQYANDREETEQREEDSARAERDKLHVSFREHLLMVLVAYGVIVLPCLLVLAALALLVCWMFGLL